MEKDNLYVADDDAAVSELLFEIGQAIAKRDRAADAARGVVRGVMLLREGMRGREECEEEKR